VNWFPPLGSIAIYVGIYPDHANGIYTIEEVQADDLPPLAVRGIIVNQEQYDALLAHCPKQNATWPVAPLPKQNATWPVA